VLRLRPPVPTFQVDIRMSLDENAFPAQAPDML
jgi:hypothetical protein